MTQTREPLPAELLALIRRTLDAAILAGCTADETIALCKQTIAAWVESTR